MGRLIPDRIFANIYEIKPSWLKRHGIKSLILDIDNTLVTYDDPKPTPKVMGWFKKIENAGIRVAFVSNNDRERVATFNEDLGYFGQGKCGKPFGRGIRDAMEYMGAHHHSTAIIGDQIFTDVLAGKCQHITAFLVAPIKDKTSLFFRTKRVLERPFVWYYYLKHNDEKRVF